MTATFRQAQDDMLAIVHEVSQAQGVLAVYDGTKNEVPLDDQIWAKVMVRHVPSGQRSLAGDRGRKRRWGREGVLWVQLHGPLGGGTSELLDVGGEYVRALQKASTEHCVWFRNVGLSEVGPSGVWYQVNVLANFTYDEVV